MQFNSQICTTVEQSQRLLSLGLKKETADMCWIPLDNGTCVLGLSNEIRLDIIPAWSLHRLIEILDTNPCVFYTNCGYDNIIDRIEEYIKEGIIDTIYMEEWCLNEEGRE